MSEMGQELKSWLKVECQGVGLDLIDAVVGASGMVEDAFDLSIPGKTIHASEMLEIGLKHTINAITSVPIEYLTAEERRVIFDLEEEIKSSISKLKYPTDSIEEAADIIQKKVLRLQSFTHKYLLEKVVECQCGKPGSSSLNKGDDKNEQGEHFAPLHNFWEIVNTVEENLTNDEYKAMGFEAIAGAAYGLADEFPEAIGIIKVNTQSDRDNVMRIIHNKVRLVPTGLEIKWWNIGDKAWFIIFQEVDR